MVEEQQPQKFDFIPFSRLSQILYRKLKNKYPEILAQSLVWFKSYDANKKLITEVAVTDVIFECGEESLERFVRQS